MLHFEIAAKLFTEMQFLNGDQNDNFEDHGVVYECVKGGGGGGRGSFTRTFI